jgi:hypothetical protein
MLAGKVALLFIIPNLSPNDFAPLEFLPSPPRADARHKQQPATVLTIGFYLLLHDGDSRIVIPDFDQNSASAC